MSVELIAVSKSYSHVGAARFTALEQVSLTVGAGELVAVLGRSGSGKSTLLNLIAGLDRADVGSVRVANQLMSGADEDALASWRGRNVGVVFQFFQLIPTLTALENVLLAMDFVNVVPRKERRARAVELLELVGIPEQADKLPSTLSGGQQQRTAIARALANDPGILVADEPTGNLDTATAASIVDLFESLVSRGRTVLVVTHDESVAKRAHRVVRLADGRVVEDRRIDRTGAIL